MKQRREAGQGSQVRAAPGSAYAHNLEMLAKMLRTKFGGENKVAHITS